MTFPVLPYEIHVYISELNKRILPKNTFRLRWVKQNNILQCSIFNDSVDKTSQMNRTEFMKNIIVTKLDAKVPRLLPLAINDWYTSAKNWTIRMNMDGVVSEWTDAMFLDLIKTLIHEICNDTKCKVFNLEQKHLESIQTCMICFDVGKPTGEILNKCYS